MEFKLLVVDDSAVVRETLSEAFGTEGYKILTASSGDEAIAILDREPVDVAVVDLHMAGLPGEEVLKHIRKKSPKTHSLVITGYPDREAKVRAIGCDGFLLKPLVLGELIETVRSFLKGKEEYELKEHVLELERVQMDKAASGEPMARILLFEPFEEAAVALGRFLIDPGSAQGVYGVSLAKDLNWAKAVFLAMHPDIVLMDLLTILDPAEALKTLLEETTHQPKEYIFYASPRSDRLKAAVDSLPGTRFEINPLDKEDVKRLGDLVRKTCLKHRLVKR